MHIWNVLLWKKRCPHSLLVRAACYDPWLRFIVGLTSGGRGEHDGSEGGKLVGGHGDKVRVGRRRSGWRDGSTKQESSVPSLNEQFTCKGKNHCHDSSHYTLSAWCYSCYKSSQPFVHTFKIYTILPPPRCVSCTVTFHTTADVSCCAVWEK